MKRDTLAVLLLVLFVGSVAAAPTLISPTTPPSRGWALPGETIGPIEANGTTTAYRFKDVKPVKEVACHTFGTFDGALVTGEMRLCGQASSSIDCPFVPIENQVWPCTDNETCFVGFIGVYNETEIRLNVASAGASTDLLFVCRD